MAEDQDASVDFGSGPAENCIEYMVFQADDTSDDQQQSLGRIQKAAIDLFKQLTTDYIWQRQSFNLRVRAHRGTSKKSPALARPVRSDNTDPANPMP